MRGHELAPPELTPPLPPSDVVVVQIRMMRPSAFILAAVPTSVCIFSRHCATNESDDSCNLIEAVGNTPLVYLRSLSEATGCKIYGKAEWLNPSGSIKDRAAKQIILEAEKSGELKKGGTIVEATGGNTGLALAALGAARGYKVVVTMPNIIAEEKIASTRRFGAEVLLQPLVPFGHPENFATKAEALGKELPNAIFTNQFENMANYRAHFTGTGAEIWQQTGGKVDAFVCASGTGGTLAGISAFLKQASGGRAQCYLVDPHGSILYQYVTKNLLETTPEPCSQIEGIGIGRITKNFKAAQLDGAFQCSDQEAVDMTFYCMKHEGLSLGPSAALNLCGAVKVARKLGRGNTVVTVLCDSGERYASKIFNPSWLKQYGLRLTDSSRGDLSFVK